MGIWLDRLGMFLIDAGVSASILLAVALLGMLAIGQPARRVRIARVAVLGMLALLPLKATGVVPRTRPVASIRAVIANPARAGTGADARAGGEPPTVDQALARPRAFPARPLRLARRGLTLLWLSGVVVGVGWIAIGLVGSMLLTRTARPASEATRGLYQSIANRPKHPPRLLVSNHARRPLLLLVGLRGAIVIPARLDGEGADLADSNHLRLALLHELAHAATSDPWWMLAARLAEAIWFWLPPVWWVVSILRLDQELLADQHAVRGFGPPRLYASSLLAMAGGETKALARGEGASVAGGRSNWGHGASMLSSRVSTLVRCPDPLEFRPPRAWRFGLIGLAVGVTLTVSSVSIRPLRTPQSLSETKDAPSGSFRVASLLIPARTAVNPGRSPLHELPLRLPERFDLELEVWGDHASLAETRVVGLPLAAARVLDEPPSWHRVRIQRDTGIQLWVDDRPTLDHPLHQTLTSWLSVEPPAGLDGRFRALALSW